MASIGIRELKAHISEIIRRVQENGEVIEVTNHGATVARIVPAHNRSSNRDENGAWTELNRLIEEISAHWPEGVTAKDAIDDVRRDV